MANPIINFFLGNDDQDEESNSRNHLDKKAYEDKIDAAVDGDIVFFKPEDSNSTRKFVDYLKAGRSIIINITNLLPESKSETLTFVQGALLVLEGQMFEVGVDIYLCTPAHIEVVRQLGRY
ncbi:MAG: cell division protein SepF [Erysipelotrichaceae bacterium]|nr:cell division protein SepF [Erysipelotrichaceae bacterium]